MKKDKKFLEATTSKKDGKLVAIASTETEDRVGDSLKMEDWDLSSYLKNPVLQAGHDHNPQFTIGIAKNIRVDGKQLIFEPHFHELTQLAKDVKAMFESDPAILRAWSVGFIPRAMYKDEEGNPLGKNELLEVSAVAVPANSECLTVAKGYGEKEAKKITNWLEKEAPTEEDEVDDVEEVEEVEEEATDETEKDNTVTISTVTGTTNGHKHIAKYDDITGAGNTSMNEEHSHQVEEFKVLEDDGHTHTLDIGKKKESEKDSEESKEKPETVKEDKDDSKEKKAKKSSKKIKDDDGDEPKEETDKVSKGDEIKEDKEYLIIEQKEIKKIGRWNKSLSKKIFDIENMNNQPSSFEYNLFTKYLECRVKNIFINTFTIPSPLLGTYLSAFKQVFSKFKERDTRRFGYGGVEYPPIYEVIQLNSKKSDDLLVDGTVFYEDKGLGIILKYEPTWFGLNVSIITSNSKREFNKDLLKEVEAWVKKNNYLKNEKFALSGEFLPETKYKWSDVILDKGNKKAVEKSVKFLNKNKKDMKSRGMLMIGEPGTGKTMTGKIMINEADSTFIWVSSRDFQKLNTITALSLAFKLARDLAPSILFIEDIDSWLRDYTVDLLKTELDGIRENKGMLTILTSNFPEKMPKALIDRPGRFHDVLKFDSPDKEMRKEMIKKWTDGIDEKLIDLIVKKTEDYTGAYIKELVDYAQMISEDEEINIGDAILKSLEKIKKQRELVEEFTKQKEKEKSVKEMERKILDGGDNKEKEVVMKPTEENEKIEEDGDEKEEEKEEEKDEELPEEKEEEAPEEDGDKDDETEDEEEEVVFIPEGELSNLDNTKEALEKISDENQTQDEKAQKVEKKKGVKKKVTTKKHKKVSQDEIISKALKQIVGSANRALQIKNSKK